MRVTLWY